MNKMKILKTKLENVLLIKPDIYDDFRGLNMEIYNEKIYTEEILNQIGKEIKFVQNNISVSSKNVLRGIHGDANAWKLVSCLKGTIYFVVANCDEKSDNFGRWQSFTLSDKNRHQVLVPPMYGNAHLVLSDEAIFHYKWSEYYTPNQFTYKFDDPKFNIWWPIKKPIISQRDEKITEKSEDKIESLNPEENLKIFRKMCIIRNFEKQVKKEHDIGEIKCPIYLSIGQEAISSTVSSFFQPDLIFMQHRGHSVYLSFNGDYDKLVDELLGRDSGCNKGKGGSPGIQDLNIGLIGHHGLIGEDVPLAVGAALGDSSKKVLCVFGDGAAEEDYVFIAMTFASMHKLPILFVCEDNNLSILTKKAERRNWELSEAIKASGMPAANIPDDPKLIAHYVKKFSRNLPAFINCRTCRHMWHVGTGQDGEPEIDRLNIFKKNLLDEGIDLLILENIENQTKKEMEELWKKHLQKQ